ncbi:MAG: hypothetical protein V7606_1524 [Burkholderiales bacterium]|jgi:hypothetical protein
MQCAGHLKLAFTNRRCTLDTDGPSFPHAAESQFDAAPGVTPAGAAVLQQTAHILHPLIRLLLQHGVTYPQLADTLKGVFIEEAQGIERTGRMTDSEVAVRTGIHRKDVKRLRSESIAAEFGRYDDARRSLTSAVFTRWLTDPAYCDKVGQPKALPRNADSAHSFDELVKSVSTDVHPRTVLNELNRLNLVCIEHDSVQLKVDAFVPNSDFAQMLEYMGANLHDHAAAAVQNMLGTGPRFLEQSIYSDAIHADSVQEVAGLARQEWTHILKRIVPEVARHEPNQTDDAADAHKAPQQHARVRLGMYFYAEGEQSAAPTFSEGDQHEPK